MRIRSTLVLSAVMFLVAAFLSFTAGFGAAAPPTGVEQPDPPPPTSTRAPGTLVQPTITQLPPITSLRLPPTFTLPPTLTLPPTFTLPPITTSGIPPTTTTVPPTTTSGVPPTTTSGPTVTPTTTTTTETTPPTTTPKPKPECRTEGGYLICVTGDLLVIVPEIPSYYDKKCGCQVFTYRAPSGRLCAGYQNGNDIVFTGYYPEKVKTVQEAKVAQEAGEVILETPPAEIVTGRDPGSDGTGVSGWWWITGGVGAALLVTAGISLLVRRAR